MNYPNTIHPAQPLPNGRYPHFIEHDAKIWTKFLTDNPLENATVAYDVHIGTPAPIPPGLPPNYARMINTLSRKRIDVLILFPNETAVVEVKPYAGPSAIGQTISYTHLVKRELPTLPNPFPCIITDTAQPDMHQICANLQVLLIETEQE
jgi:hypothetical protein